VRATLDLVTEMERRNLFAFLIPSIFTPLPDTRMEHAKGVVHTRDLTPLQWQLILKCWKFNLQPGQYYVSWAPGLWRLGSLVLWAFKLRRLHGPNCTWPVMMFSGAVPEPVLARWGKLYATAPLTTKSRRELVAAVRPSFQRFFRSDAESRPGDVAHPPPGQNQPRQSLRVVGTA
jgi:hypothetical protein